MNRSLISDFCNPCYEVYPLSYFPQQEHITFPMALQRVLDNQFLYEDIDLEVGREHDSGGIEINGLEQLHPRQDCAAILAHIENTLVSCQHTAGGAHQQAWLETAELVKEHRKMWERS